MTAPLERPLRIGVLGAARIARLFAAAVKPSKVVHVRSIASRDGPGATPAESVDIMMTLEALATSARERRVVEIAPAAGG